MKQQKSNEGSLSTNHQILESSLESDDLEGSFDTISSENMMADSSFNASVTTKMLMPHELGANSVGTSSLVGQHSIHGASFYHSASNSNIATGFNGFHNTTFPSYSNNGIMANSSASSFSNLVHQQPITLSNNHSIPTISSTMPPPLIPYHQPFYTSSANNLSNTTTNEIENQQKKTCEKANNNKNNVSENEQLVATSNELTTTTADDSTELAEEASQEGEEPEIDIVISNVVCAFSVRCHLALKEIALHGANVEYKRENGMVTMKLRKPYTTASIWSSGMFSFRLNDSVFVRPNFLALYR